MKNLYPLSKKLMATICVAGLLSAGLSSCYKSNINQNYTPPPAALVSFTQASPDESPINFFLNGNQVNYYPLYFGQSLDYIQAYAGLRTVNFYNASTAAAILSDTITFKQNAIYSVFLANTNLHPEMVVLKDTLVKPTSGNASIRFINLSPDAPAVSLAIQGGAVLAANRAYKGFTSFMPITGNTTYAFEVRQGTSTTVLATLSNVTLNSGYVYTIWYHGLASGTTADDKLGVDVIPNAYFIQ